MRALFCARPRRWPSSSPAPLPRCAGPDRHRQQQRSPGSGSTILRGPPVGGNPGVTLGQQRLNVFQYAANMWEARSNPQRGHHGPRAVHAPGRGRARIGGADLRVTELPGRGDHRRLVPRRARQPPRRHGQRPVQPEINANFSHELRVLPRLRQQRAGRQSDLLAVVLHELGHGLGFSNLVNEADGTRCRNGAGHLLAVHPRRHHGQDLERDDRPRAPASAINIGRVSWNGVNVNATCRTCSSRRAALGVNVPGGLGPFLFGPRVSAARSPRRPDGDVILADDGVAPTPTPARRSSTW